MLSNIPICRLFVRIFAPDCDVTKLEAKAEGGEEMKMLTYGAKAVSLVLGTKLAMLGPRLRAQHEHFITHFILQSTIYHDHLAGNHVSK